MQEHPEAIETKTDRLIQVRQRLNLNPKQFAERIGEAPSNYYQIESGKRQIGKHKSNELIKVLHLNPVWFETGEGEMFEAEPIEEKPKVGSMISSRKAQLFLSQLPEKDAELYIPYYDVEITAGKIELYFDDVEETAEGYVYAPQYQGCIMCNVKGNSMYDLIHPGARLYIYPMPDKKYIDFGQIYLVILNNNFRILKYVRRHPTDDKLVVLASHNKEHDSWDVEKADIINLFLVKGYENQTAM